MKQDIDLVYLVNAGNDEGMASIANYHCFPALGVLALGTWLRAAFPDIELVVRDGGVFSQKKIVEEIQALQPSLVGVSVLATSYKNSLEIAEYSKDSGAITVFGNDQASQLASKILQHRQQVDFVIGSEYGEKSLEFLIRSLIGEPISLNDIPDLAYRENGKVQGFNFDKDKKLLSIVKNPLYKIKSRKTALDIFPVIDRTLYPAEHWQKYLENYLERYSQLHEEEVTGVTAMNRARGCSRAKDPAKCSFCDMLLDISFSSPEVFWEEVQTAHEQVNATVFYEACDSFSSFPGLIDGIVKSKPNLDFDPKFFVYAQALDIVRKPALVEQLKELGVFRVNIGLEAGSNTTLKHLKGKYDSVETNYQAIKMLNNAGIHIYGSFVMGSQMETQETLRETVDWAKKIMDEHLLSDVEAQPILPLPGNRQGRQLKQSGTLPKALIDSDWPWDTDRMSELYVSQFSGVSYKETVQASIEIREHAKKHRIVYGSGVGREETYEK